ncbi:MAG: hypothetical protein KGS48_09210 [Bacteroidetes bacterium]|nr:hypothetical protein [Bacteroidota bacterium]
MKPRFEAFHFRERVFRVQESFLLPEFLLVQLALNSAPYLINPGIYPVKEHDDWMIVIF